MFLRISLFFEHLFYNSYKTTILFYQLLYGSLKSYNIYFIKNKIYNFLNKNTDKLITFFMFFMFFMLLNLFFFTQFNFKKNYIWVANELNLFFFFFLVFNFFFFFTYFYKISIKDFLYTIFFVYIFALFIYFQGINKSSVYSNLSSKNFNIFSFANLTFLNVNSVKILDNIDFLYFFFLINVIFFFCLMFSYFYMFNDKNNFKFFFFLSFFAISMIGLVFSKSLILLFFFWELIGVSSFFLIGYYNNKISSFKSALKALCVNKFSDSLFLITISLYYIIFKTFTVIEFSNHNFFSINLNFLWFNLNLNLIFIIFITFLCLVKSAQFVFFYWLLDSMDAPVPASALIHSATLVTAGMFILLKFKYFFLVFQNFSIFVMFLCLITACIASASACFQSDLKKLLAYSTISNCSLLIIILISCDKKLFFLYLSVHGLIKSFLFLNIGFLFLKNKHKQDFKFFFFNKNIIHLFFMIFFMFLLSASPLTYLYDLKHNVGSFFKSDQNLGLFFNYLFVLFSIFSFFYSFNFFYCLKCNFRSNKKFDFVDNKYCLKNFLFIYLILILFSITVMLVFYNYNLFFFNQISIDKINFYFLNSFVNFSKIKLYNFILLLITYLVYCNFNKKKKINLFFLFFFFFLF